MRNNKHRGKIFVLLLVMFAFVWALSLPVYAQTYHGDTKTQNVVQNGKQVQRIYNGGGQVYIYTHKVTYHNVIGGQDYTQYLEVENGCQAIPTASGFNTKVTKYTTPAAPSGFEFVGWVDNANSVSPLSTKTVTGNTDLYAIYRKSVTIRNSRNNGVIGSGYCYYNNGTLKQKAKIKLSSAKDDAAWTEKGYREDSETRTLDATYIPGLEYEFSDNKTLHCLWTIDVHKTLRFNNNGGQVGTPEVIHTITCTYNSASGHGYLWNGNWIDSANITVTIPYGNPVKSGYTYQGWINDQNHGTYQVNDTYQFTGGINDEATGFTCSWKANSEPFTMQGFAGVRKISATSGIAFTKVTISGTFDNGSVHRLYEPSSWVVEINGQIYRGFDGNGYKEITGSWPAGTRVSVYRENGQGNYNCTFTGTFSN